MSIADVMGAGSDEDYFREMEDGVGLTHTPANQPVADFSPYLGDYDCVLAVGKDFCGIFSASNAPDPAHFPNGVIYQRNADFASRRLLGVDGSTTVARSIDPFFFRVSE